MKKLASSPEHQLLPKGNKMRTKLAGVVAAFFMILGVSTAAHAGPGCTIPPPDDGGNISINAYGGSCSLGDVSASGMVSISVNEPGDLTVGNISAGSSVTIYTVSGSETVGSITAGTLVLAIPVSGSFTASGDISGPESVTISGNSVSSTGGVTSSTGNVFIAADQGSVSITGAISGASGDIPVAISSAGGITTGAITGPQIDISAYNNGTAGDLTIGSGGISSITSNASASGSVSIYSGFSASAQNPGSGPNNITVSTAGALNIGHSSSGGGSLHILASGGTITLPAGEFDVSGPNAFIWLQGQHLSTAATTLMANDTSVAGSYHYIEIEANTINHTGAFLATANGNGSDADDPGSSFVGSYSWYYDIDNGPITISGSSSFSLKANGNHTFTQIFGNSLLFDGGDILLQSQGATDHGVYLNNPSTGSTAALNNTGTFTMDAQGNGGDGGTVSVNVGAATIDTPTFTLNANGPSTGDGAGGTISYNTTSTTLGSTTIASLTANAAAAGNGAASASAITFKPGSSVALGLNGGEFSFSANGGVTSGDAGTILIDPTPGGARVNVPTASPMVVVSAVAPGSSGKGGNVTITSNLSLFDVNGGIKVDASADADTSVSDGTVTLNSVPCQQYKTGSSSWPLTYWDCTGSPDEIQSDFATNALPITNPTTLIGSVQTLLGDKITSMYTLSSLADFNSFFKPSPAITDAAGTSFIINPTGPSGIYTTIYEGTGPNSTLKGEAVAHEFGHAINFANYSGGSTPSDSTNYENYAVSDYLNLDYSVIGATELTSTYRDPCVAGAQPAPLAGVINNTTGAAFCSPLGVLQDPNNIGYANMTNSGILNSVDTHIFSLDTHGGFTELYAQIFAYEDFAYANVGTTSNLYDPTADLLFFNNYMYCTGKWALAVAQGNTVPPASGPAYCLEGDSTIGWSYLPFNKTKTH